MPHVRCLRVSKTEAAVMARAAISAAPAAWTYPECRIRLAAGQVRDARDGCIADLPMSTSAFLLIHGPCRWSERHARAPSWRPLAGSATLTRTVQAESLV